MKIKAVSISDRNCVHVEPGRELGIGYSYLIMT